MKVVFNPIAVGEISDALNGGKQVELRQTLQRQYDDSNDLADALFEGTRASFSETRVTWRAIPDGTTKEQVVAQLAKFPNARLRRILSHEIVLNDGQERLFATGFTGANADKAFADFKTRTGVKSTSWDKACQDALIKSITDSQIVRYGEGNSAGQPADAPVLYNGKVQYKVIVFNQEAKDDKDYRNEKAVTQSIVLTSVAAEEAVTA